MSNLNSFDLIGNNIRLQKIAKQYKMNGSVKFSVDVWKYDHLDNIVAVYTCSYVDLNNGDPISASISRETLEKAFEDIKIYFLQFNEALKK